MANWSFNEFSLIKDGVVIKTFESKIFKILPYKNNIIVLLYKLDGEGVYLVASDGSVVWRIDTSDHKFYSPPFYTSIFFYDDQLVAYEFTGCDCYVDIKTGKVTRVEFTK